MHRIPAAILAAVAGLLAACSSSSPNTSLPPPLDSVAPQQAESSGTGQAGTAQTTAGQGGTTRQGGTGQGGTGQGGTGQGGTGQVTIVQLGQVGGLPEGISVVLSTLTVGGDKDGPWLTVHVRADNRGREEHTMPQLGLRCAGNAEVGFYQLGTKMQLTDKVPAGSFLDGTLNLYLPGDGRDGGAVPECRAPAYVQVALILDLGENDAPTGPSLRVPLPPATVAALNAAR